MTGYRGAKRIKSRDHTSEVEKVKSLIRQNTSNKFDGDGPIFKKAVAQLRKDGWDIRRDRATGDYFNHGKADRTSETHKAFNRQGKQVAVTVPTKELEAAAHELAAARSKFQSVAQNINSHAGEHRLASQKVMAAHAKLNALRPADSKDPRYGKIGELANLIDRDSYAVKSTKAQALMNEITGKRVVGIPSGYEPAGERAGYKLYGQLRNPVTGKELPEPLMMAVDKKGRATYFSHDPNPSGMKSREKMSVFLAGKDGKGQAGDVTLAKTERAKAFAQYEDTFGPKSGLPKDVSAKAVAAAKAEYDRADMATQKIRAERGAKRMAKSKPVGMDGLTREQRSGRVRQAVQPPIPVAEGATNMDRFRATYEAELTARIKANPGKFRYGVENVPRMASAMVDGLKVGISDHKAEAVARTAKRLGIKPTLGALKAYLNEQPPPAPRPQKTPLQKAEAASVAADKAKARAWKDLQSNRITGQDWAAASRKAEDAAKALAALKGDNPGWSDSAREASAKARGVAAPGEAKPRIGDKKLAMAAGMDAGNKNMRASGRTKWNAEDMNAATKAHDSVMGKKPAKAVKAKPAQPKDPLRIPGGARKGDLAIVESSSRISYVKGPSQVSTSFAANEVASAKQDGSVSKFTYGAPPSRGRGEHITVIPRENLTNVAEAMNALNKDRHLVDTREQAMERIKPFMKPGADKLTAKGMGPKELQEVQQTVGTKRVKLPNGHVLDTTWYRPPSFSNASDPGSVERMDAKYRDWIKKGKPKNFFSIAGPLAIAGAGALAFDATRNQAMAAGQSKTSANLSAVGAGAAASGTVAATGWGIGKAISLAARAAPVAGKVLSRAVPVAAVGLAAYEIGKGAVQGYSKGGLSGAAKGAGTGALDFATMGAYSHFSEGKQGRLSGEQQKTFAAAQSNYDAMQAAKKSDEPQGWSDQARIAAYITRVANSGGTPVNMPYGGAPRKKSER